ncbi:uncharacterized protein METZ01_LOCUS299342, partial [marine metagenome]
MVRILLLLLVYTSVEAAPVIIPA